MTDQNAPHSAKAFRELAELMDAEFAERGLPLKRLRLGCGSPRGPR
jgi:hypothetical protein